MAAETTDFNYRRYAKLIVKRRYLLMVVFLTVLTIAAGIHIALPKEYEATTTIATENGVLTDVVKGIAISPYPENNMTVLSYALKSRTIVGKVLTDLRMIDERHQGTGAEAIIKGVQDRTSVNVKEPGGVFVISFRNSDPVIARDFLNHLITQFVEDSKVYKRQGSSSASRFLAQQIASYKEKLKRTQAQANNFKRSIGVALTETPTQIQLEINKLQQKIDETIAKRNELETMQHLLGRTEDPLQVRLNLLQNKLADITARFTENYPEVMDLRSEIDQIKEIIRKTGPRSALMHETPEQVKVMSEIRTLKNLEQSYHHAITQKQALLKTLPSILTTLEELQRNESNQKTFYDQMVARYEQSEVTRRAEAEDITVSLRVLDPAALPLTPSTPSAGRILVIGIIFGLATGLGVLALLDNLDTSVRTLETLKSLELPILAVVHRIENPSERKAKKKKDFCFFTFSLTYFTAIVAVFHLETIKVFI